LRSHWLDLLYLNPPVHRRFYGALEHKLMTKSKSLDHYLAQLQLLHSVGEASEELDETIHDYFSGQATEANNHGAESQAALIGGSASDEDLDEAVYNFFSARAAVLNNQGMDAQVGFIFRCLGTDALDKILKPQECKDYYFLEDKNWGHCFVSDRRTDVSFCLAVRRDDEDQRPIMIGAVLSSDSQPLSEGEKADLMQSFGDNPEWIEDPNTWGWQRCDQLVDVDVFWWPAIHKIFGIEPPRPNAEAVD
jgi:hypothetical protein